MGDLIEERWQTKITSLKEGLKYLYNTKEFYDVQFCVQGENFKAHKLLLSSRSSEFARMLQKSPECNTPINVPEESVTKTGFSIVLHFIYEDNLEAPDKQSVIEAYHAALYFKIKSLQDRCLKEMETWIITIDEVFNLIDAGSSISYLKNKCIQFIQDNASEVLTSSLFSTASLKTMKIVLGSEALKSIPAIERIKHVVKWAKVHLNMETLDNYSPVSDLLKSVTTEQDETLLSKLDFQDLIVQDLSDIPVSYPELLTEHEIVTFMIYKKTKKLPIWCKVEPVSADSGISST